MLRTRAKYENFVKCFIVYQPQLGRFCRGLAAIRQRGSQDGEVLPGCALPGIALAWRMINHAQCAQNHAIDGKHGHAGIKADAGISGDQSIPGKALVGKRTLTLQQPLVENGVRAESQVTGRFLYIQSNVDF